MMSLSSISGSSEAMKASSTLPYLLSEAPRASSGSEAIESSAEEKAVG